MNQLYKSAFFICFLNFPNASSQKETTGTALLPPTGPGTFCQHVHLTPLWHCALPLQTITVGIYQVCCGWLSGCTEVYGSECTNVCCMHTSQCSMCVDINALNSSTTRMYVRAKYLGWLMIILIKLLLLLLLIMKMIGYYVIHSPTNTLKRAY